MAELNMLCNSLYLSNLTFSVPLFPPQEFVLSALSAISAFTQDPHDNKHRSGFL